MTATLTRRGRCAGKPEHLDLTARKPGVAQAMPDAEGRIGRRRCAEILDLGAPNSLEAQCVRGTLGALEPQRRPIEG